MLRQQPCNHCNLPSLNNRQKTHGTQHELFALLVHFEKDEQQRRCPQNHRKSLSFSMSCSAAVVLAVEADCATKTLMTT